MKMVNAIVEDSATLCTCVLPQKSLFPVYDTGSAWNGGYTPRRLRVVVVAGNLASAGIEAPVPHGGADTAEKIAGLGNKTTSHLVGYFGR